MAPLLFSLAALTFLASITRVLQEAQSDVVRFFFVGLWQLSAKTDANTATQLVSLFTPVDISHGERLKGQRGGRSREP